MKTKLIIILFVLIGITNLEAQVTLKPGVRAGANFSKFTNYDCDFKTGFYIGGQLAIKFNKLYTLQPEITFSHQGGDRTLRYDLLNIYNPDNPTVLSNGKENLTIDYLSFGAMSKFNFGKGFFLLAGPTLDFKVNDNFENNFFSMGQPIGFDMAIVMGVGYKLDNGLAFEARFKQGLIDIFGNNYNTNIDENNNGNYDEIVLNQLFQVGVSYSFDIK